MKLQRKRRAKLTSANLVVPAQAGTQLGPGLRRGDGQWMSERAAKDRSDLMTLDHRADTLIGQDLQQQAMIDAAIDDVDGVDAASRRLER